MHIAFLTPEYPHVKMKQTGGLGTSIKNLANALVINGVKVTVFVYGQKKNEIFNEDGIDFHLIQDKKYLFVKWYLYRKYIQKYVNKVIDLDGISLIEAPDWTGITAFMNFRVPLIIRFHGSDTYFCHLEKRKQKIKNKLFETLAVRKAQAYIAPTKFAGELSARLFGLSKQKIMTIYHGLDLEQFQNPNSIEFDKGLILYIGTLIRKKGVFELPYILKKVLKENPYAKLVLIGNDSYDIKTNSVSTWELLQNEFKKLEIFDKIEYLGKIPYNEVKDYIQKANVCVFPTYAETLGMVTIEAMAMQKAIVNSNIGWAQELMEDGKSGFLVYPANHKKYAQRINSILQEEDFAKNMGVEASKFVTSKFDVKIIVQKNMQFYKSLL
ncbi:glycosyl transferase family 1 [Flavobacterium columnare NBRC 100251 = ATCC 23463]|nr:glycosyl transferase family 1 [Flavobacterium columnare NBRC 100251 = ATCC 23463]GEM57875.1 glycoside hydrolase [Flavobacterium columnare NBRC 100251 = ATCC 23463]